MKTKLETAVRYSASGLIGTTAGPFDVRLKANAKQLSVYPLFETASNQAYSENEWIPAKTKYTVKFDREQNGNIKISAQFHIVSKDSTFSEALLTPEEKMRGGHNSVMRHHRGQNKAKVPNHSIQLFQVIPAGGYLSAGDHFLNAVLYHVHDEIQKDFLYRNTKPEIREETRQLIKEVIKENPDHFSENYADMVERLFASKNEFADNSDYFEVLRLSRKTLIDENMAKRFMARIRDKVKPFGPSFHPSSPPSPS
jgi:hypothetical protein